MKQKNLVGFDIRITMPLSMDIPAELKEWQKFAHLRMKRTKKKFATVYFTPIQMIYKQKIN